MMNLTREEQETNFSQTAEDRMSNIVRVYTDDPVTIRKMDNAGWKGTPVGQGKQYVCENAYMRVAAKRTLEISDERKELLRETFAKNVLSAKNPEAESE